MYVLTVSRNLKMQDEEAGFSTYCYADVVWSSQRNIIDPSPTTDLGYIYTTLFMHMLIYTQYLFANMQLPQYPSLFKKLQYISYKIH